MAVVLGAGARVPLGRCSTCEITGVWGHAQDTSSGAEDMKQTGEGDSVAGRMGARPACATWQLLALTGFFLFAQSSPRWVRRPHREGSALAQMP